MKQKILKLQLNMVKPMDIKYGNRLKCILNGKIEFRVRPNKYSVFFIANS